MPRRITLCFAVSLMLVAALGGGCSRSRESKPPTPSARSLAAIWSDILAQRDAMHAIFTKDLELVTHEDCASVSAAARRIDELTSEFVNRVGATSAPGEGRLRALGDALGRVSAVLAKVRETALAEAPGAWVGLRFPLDQSLKGLESYFTADDLGNQSVTARPDFETSPPPPPFSPI
ncbi:MAG: hypothetical protein ACHQ6T_09865 [Myxococcota bacterium]